MADLRHQAQRDTLARAARQARPAAAFRRLLAALGARASA